MTGPRRRPSPVPRVFHAHLAAKMRALPDVEVLVNTYSTPAVAQSIARRIVNARRMPSYRPAGAFKARVSGNMVYAHYTGGQAPVRPRPVTTEGAPLSKVIVWAMAHLDRQVGVGALAEKAGMDRAAFCRRFLVATGRTPLEWLTVQRVRRARHLLARSDFTISEIAARCGFPTIVELGEVFFQHSGLSPHTYRATYRGAHGRH